jgi:hypothetical protein
MSSYDFPSWVLCNNLRNVVGIYRRKFFVKIFMDEFYHRNNFVGNVVCKTYTSSYCLPFFISFFPTAILSVYTIKIFLFVFIDGFNDKKNSVNKYYCNILLTEKFHRYFFYVFINYLVVTIFSFVLEANVLTCH